MDACPTPRPGGCGCPAAIVGGAPDGSNHGFPMVLFGRAEQRWAVRISLNLRQLECFLAVADELHFARAAQRLRVSPASMSEAVAALERRLGARLFDRSTRRVRLTASGMDFLQDVREPYEGLMRAHETARERSRRTVNIIIAHTPELGHLLLPALLDRLAGAMPAGEAGDRVTGPPAWRPLLMHTPEQIRSITDGSVDIGLCWSASVHPPLASVPLGEIPIIAVLPADDPLATRRAVGLPDLRARRILVTPRADNPFIDSLLQAALVQAGVPMSNVAEVQRYDELAVHVAAGREVGLHPGTIAMMNRVPGVVFRVVADPALRVTICALTRSGPQPRPIEVLIDNLIEIVEEIDLDPALSMR